MVGLCSRTTRSISPGTTRSISPGTSRSISRSSISTKSVLGGISGISYKQGTGAIAAFDSGNKTTTTSPIKTFCSSKTSFVSIFFRASWRTIRTIRAIVRITSHGAGSPIATCYSCNIVCCVGVIALCPLSRARWRCCDRARSGCGTGDGTCAINTFQLVSSRSIAHSGVI